MALNPALLQQSIKAAFDAQKVKTSNPDEAINSLAQMMANAIHAYVSAAQVAPGIPVTTAGTAAAQSGVTTGPGTLI